MDEQTRKNELIRAMTATELSPKSFEQEITVRQYNKLPISRVVALGAGFEPMIAAVQQVLNGGKAVSGLYKVTIPPGTHLSQFKGSTDFLGTALSNSTNSIVNQAHLSPLICDPTMVFVAMTLANIDKKLDTIQETQREMLDFMVQKEKSALKGDLDFLTDVFNNYKYNWNSDKYKNANHIKVLDIRQNSGRMVDFYREQIKKHLEKQTILHSDRDVKKQLTQVQDNFSDYQLSLYIYAFAYFLEVLLQENFDAEYLESISKKIDSMALQYKDLYSDAYTKIEGRARSSLQSKLLSGLSTVNRATGEAIAKIPLISKSPLDEALIEAGQKIGSLEENKSKIAMRQLVERQSSCVRHFINQIDSINHVYNSEMTMIFDKENIYLVSN